MKTNKIFKNILSLLTLGLVVFSCSKPSEDPKEGQNLKALDLVVTSLKFEKAKNLKETNVSEFYEKLFITRTPARDKNKTKTDSETDNGYPAMFSIETADIVGDSIINIKLPFNSKFTNLTGKANATATITFKSAAQGVKLGETTINGTTADITFEIPTTELTKEKLSAASTKKVFRFTKPGATANDPISVKEYTVVLKFSETKSDKCEIKPDDFKFTVASNGINAINNFRAITGTTRAANSIVKAHYAAANTTTSNANDGTESKPFEFQLRIGKSTDTTNNGNDSENGELPKTTGATETTYFKADALKLPDGAYIEVGNTPYPASADSNVFACNSVNPITGNTKSINNGQNLRGNTDASTKKSEYKFTVVAQDGTTKKYYKLTINATAPTGT
ncbi:hypothetical protein [Ichthyobacterium seriolicida]|uniref:Uncharacterized protein n=1 Tax=Ichthyobacterium seriolicida TaxID=242600 RepID=A0A1J1E4Z7_9FLAO|nr:hypothetical protein [Ichthyobacterium seriolicida]BAV95132.1 hypothetical protein JBKA6_1119 [Ichthyobacterium seriolicida]